MRFTYTNKNPRRSLLLFFIGLIIGQGLFAETLSPVLLPANPRPGDTLTVAFVSREDGDREREGMGALILDAADRRLARASFFDHTHSPDGGIIRTALVAIPSTAAAGPAFVQLETSEGQALIRIPFVIEGRDFVHEEIPLNQKNTEIRTVPDPQKNAEAERLWAVLSRTGGVVYHSGAFIPPVTATRRTSFFADRRVFRYTDGSTDTSIHGGIDYGVPRGTPVSACGRGRVAIAGFRIVTGYTVVLEHAPGLYSLYYHMDGLNVEEGSVVEAGALLGLSGATGLATGPHLHWEVRVSRVMADPDFFVDHPLLDKDMIVGKMGY